MPPHDIIYNRAEKRGDHMSRMLGSPPILRICRPWGERGKSSLLTSRGWDLGLFISD
jgi:hypothetical protein